MYYYHDDDSGIHITDTSTGLKVAMTTNLVIVYYNHHYQPISSCSAIMMIKLHITPPPLWQGPTDQGILTQELLSLPLHSNTSESEGKEE